MNVLIFQHVACEHPGQLRSYLRHGGVNWRTVELDEGDAIPSLEEFDALWVMGGPMDVWQIDKHPWLVAEKEAIRRWVRDLKRPFLGVCLGHQLLADALGGKCEVSRRPEIGVLDVELTPDGLRDPLFRGMERTQKVLQWHSVNVVSPPSGALVLASSADCAIQAMKVGSCAWSIQYHVEAEADTVENWGAIPAYRDALERSAGAGSLTMLRAAAAEALPSMSRTSKLLYDNFTRAVSLARV